VAESERDHLADLHATAAELGVPDYRLLRRRELVRAIRRRQDEKIAEPGQGVLAITPGGYGFLRVEDGESETDDIYISAAQIKRCELEEGDTVAGPARPPRRGERHPALIRVERVNGAELEEDGEDEAGGEPAD
jgi:transcription termination factor Rho